ncbi:MAG: hypothetical protein IJ113_06905 [Eggerthellaceae bacterium]|nr:hypothetical protein [Eggerthellaceae bacterium]MBQ9147813.1 hypothetical protein [Rikenellaceae bacterium]
METFIMPSIAVICCVLAFAFKQAIKNDRAHDFIPLGCALLGIVLACAFLGISLDSLATGAVSGFAATGLWEQIIHILPEVGGSHAA